MGALDVRVYAITDRLDDGLIGRVEAALEGGATVVQVRLKGASGRALVEVSRALVPRCEARGARLIVNDRVDVALAAGAHGVHVGPEDVPVEDVRRLAPPGFLIGGSSGDPERAQALVRAGVDYLGVGAIFDASASKRDASAPRGADALVAVRAAVSVPLVAIGGLTVAQAPACVAAGADGVAAIRALIGAGEPADVAAATAAMRRAVDGALGRA